MKLSSVLFVTIAFLAGLSATAFAHVREDAKYGPFTGKVYENKEGTDLTAEIVNPRVLIGGTSYLVSDDGVRTSDAALQGKAAAVCLAFGYDKVLGVTTQGKVLRLFHRPMTFQYSWSAVGAWTHEMRINAVERMSANAPYLHSVLCGTSGPVTPVSLF